MAELLFIRQSIKMNSQILILGFIMIVIILGASFAFPLQKVGFYDHLQSLFLPIWLLS